MLNSKAIQLLRALNRTETERLRRFARSSYCNTNQNALDLLEKLLPHHPHFSGSALKKRQFFKALFPGKTYNDAYFRKQLSGLYQMIRSFLAFEEWNSNKPLQQVFLLRQLKERQLVNVFQIQFDQAVEDLNQGANRSASYFQQAYQLAEEASDEEAQALAMQLQHLDISFLIKRLGVHCDILSMQGAVEDNILSKYVHAMLDKAGNPYLQIPAVAIFWQLCRAWQEPEEPALYYQFTRQLQQHLDIFPISEQRWLYSHAEKYCWLQLRAGFREFVDQLFLVQRVKLEKGLLMTNGQLPPQQFQELVTLGLQLKKLNWVRQFIADYHDLLPEGDRMDIRIYQTARVDQAEGKLKEAASALTAHNFNLSDLATKAALLHFQLLYQTSQIPQLEEEMDNWRLRWMRSPELSTAERKSLLNCISVLRQVVRLKKKVDRISETDLPGKKAGLLARIDKLYPITHERWLKSIVQEMSGGATTS